MAIYHVSNGTAKRMDGAGDGSLYAPVTSIATPENGSTASKAYAVGEMFIRDGKLCTCTTAIGSGGSFSKGTNYSEGSVGEVLKELNSNKIGFINEDTYTGMSVHGIYISKNNSFNIGNSLTVLFGGRTTNAFAYILTRDGYAIPILQTPGVSVSVSNNVATITNNTDTGMRAFYMKMTES